MCFHKALVSTKIDRQFNGQAFDPVFKWYLNDLKINLPNKSYSRDNRLNKIRAHIKSKAMLHKSQEFQ